MTSTAPEPRLIRSAFPELLALAVAWRADWNETSITGAITEATRHGMTRDAILVSLARLMADPRATPRDLVPSATDPTVRRHPDPDIAKRGAGACREALKGGG